MTLLMRKDTQKKYFLLKKIKVSLLIYYNSANYIANLN